MSGQPALDWLFACTRRVPKNISEVYNLSPEPVV